MATVNLGKDARATQLHKESKNLKLGLTKLLEIKAPGDQEVEFQRKNLRNTYLNLLFTCTFTRQAQGVDNLLWLDTCYPLIHLYRQQLSSLEKGLSARGKGGRDANGPGDGSAAGGGAGKGGKGAAQAKRGNTVEYRKTVSEFRKFLAAEEAFWQELASRLVRVYGLDEARPHLAALGISADPESFSNTTGSTSFDSTDSGSGGMMRVAGAAGADAGKAALQAASVPGNRDRVLEIVHKALICCGDLARYRELYNDARSRSADADGPARGGGRGRGRGGAQGGKDGKTKPRKDFSKAAACYEQSRLLIPDNGNPSNQLAVISTYESDAFSSTYHYYRALCVRVPFDTARTNLEKTLGKAVGEWVNEGSSITGRAGAKLSVSEDERVQRFLHDFVVLHGLFYTKAHFASILPFSEHILSTLSSLVSERALLADQIVRVVVTGLSASWTTRLWRNGPSGRSSRSRVRRAIDDQAEGEDEAARQTQNAVNLHVEHQILAHVLGCFRTLADVGRKETTETLENARNHPPQGPGGANAARNISAVFRRTLPALRIATKWMKSHLEYIERCAERAASASQSSESSQASSLGRILTEAETEEIAQRTRADIAVVSSIVSFWHSYVELINMLRFAFPFNDLPNLGTVGPVGAPTLCLEEDSEMRGFAPTKKAMLPLASGGMGDACGPTRPSQLHPNEEQLMRIADLLIDAKVVAESEASPIVFDDERNTFIYAPEGKSGGGALPSEPQGQGHAHGQGFAQDSRMELPHSQEGENALAQQQPELAASHGAEDGSEAMSEATDDVVDLAMRAVAERPGQDHDGISEDEEEDTILIPSRSGSGMPQTPTAAFRSVSDGLSLPPGASPTPTTAQDLLLQVLNGRSSASAAPGNVSTPPAASPPTLGMGAVSTSTPQPHLLFGGVAGAKSTNGSPALPGQGSIWAPGPADVQHSAPPMFPWNSPGRTSFSHGMERSESFSQQLGGMRAAAPQAQAQTQAQVQTQLPTQMATSSSYPAFPNPIAMALPSEANAFDAHLNAQQAHQALQSMPSYAHLGNSGAGAGVGTGIGPAPAPLPPGYSQSLHFGSQSTPPSSIDPNGAFQSPFGAQPTPFGILPRQINSQGQAHVQAQAGQADLDSPFLSQSHAHAHPHAHALSYDGSQTRPAMSNQHQQGHGHGRGRGHGQGYQQGYQLQHQYPHQQQQQQQQQQQHRAFG